MSSFSIITTIIFFVLGPRLNPNPTFNPNPNPTFNPNPNPILNPNPIIILPIIVVTLKMLQRNT